MSENNVVTTSSEYPLIPQNMLDQGPAFWEKRLVWDLHGVIVNWIEPFCKFASRVTGRNIDPDKVRYYRAGYDSQIPMSPAEWDTLFTQFARLGKGGYGDLKPYPGAVEAMQEIAAAGITSEIWTWTPGASEIDFNGKAYGSGIAQGVTLKLIEKLGLPVDKREVRFMSSSVKGANLAHEHYPLLVEDNPTTAVHVATDFGQACLLLPQPYNKGLLCPGVTRLEGYSQLAPTVIEFFKQLETAGVLL